jgi:hypothetical protein
VLALLSRPLSSSTVCLSRNIDLLEIVDRDGHIVKPSAFHQCLINVLNSTMAFRKRRTCLFQRGCAYMSRGMSEEKIAL